MATQRAITLRTLPGPGAIGLNWNAQLHLSVGRSWPLRMPSERRLRHRRRAPGNAVQGRPRRGAHGRPPRDARWRRL